METVFNLLPILDQQLNVVVSELVQTLSLPNNKYSNYIVNILQDAELIKCPPNLATDKLIAYISFQLNNGICEESIINHIVARIKDRYGYIPPYAFPFILNGGKQVISE